jgi:hypothetical protein
MLYLIHASLCLEIPKLESKPLDLNGGALHRAFAWWHSAPKKQAGLQWVLSELGCGRGHVHRGRDMPCESHGPCLHACDCRPPFILHGVERYKGGSPQVGGWVSNTHICVEVVWLWGCEL